MKWRLALVLALAFCTAGLAAEEQGMKTRPVEQTPEWQKLTSLVGDWTGSFEENGQKMDATVEIRLTGGGSALMHVLGKGSPYEMVTMFHQDLKRLIATHYCAAHNQPRMALIPSKDPNTLTFDFLDGTNIAPGDGYMARIEIRFIDADHHDELWSFHKDGKNMPGSVFHFTRKK